MDGVTVINHPLVQHKLTIMRKKETSTAGFRRLLREISTLLCYEVTRDLELTMETIETPMQAIQAPVLEGKKLVFASILRAGNGLLEGMLELVPSARVSHVGVYRDHETLEAVEYYFKAPENLSRAPGHRRRSDAGDRQFLDRRHRQAEGTRRHEAALPLPAGRARRHPKFPARPSGRADLHGLDRQPPQREGLHRAGARRCRRPDVRHEVDSAFLYQIRRLAEPGHRSGLF